MVTGTQPDTTDGTGAGMAVRLGTTREDSDANDRSVLGESYAARPLVLSVRGHLDSIKRLLKGDLYIGRGSRQRSLGKKQVLQYLQSIAVRTANGDFQVPGNTAGRQGASQISVDNFRYEIGLPLPGHGGLSWRRSRRRVPEDVPGCFRPHAAIKCSSRTRDLELPGQAPRGARERRRFKSR